jgi:hypothetical protein
VFVQHASASLVVQENADRDVAVGKGFAFSSIGAYRKLAAIVLHLAS